MKILKKRSKSFATRLSLSVLLITAALMLSCTLFIFTFTRETTKREAVSSAVNALDNTISQIETVLKSVETALNNNEWNILENKDNPEEMYKITRRVLENNPAIIGSAIAFEPFYYPEKGYQYSPYSYKENGIIKEKQLGTEDYEYHYMDWYQIPKFLQKSYWSEPYFDDGGGETIMTTYSKPLYDQYGDLYGIFTADIDLKWLTETVNKIKPYPNSYNIMIGRGATYIIHKDPERILSETYFTSIANSNNPLEREIGLKMIAGEKGYQKLRKDGIQSYVFYAPIPSIGWSLATISQSREVFANVTATGRIVIGFSIIGLILLFIICTKSIRKITEPLRRFAVSAISIANGDFNAPLPVIKSADEMKQLRDSFETMQHSLTAYIEELKQTTASKERIESELRIANHIQMSMLPKVFPPFPERNDIDIYATLTPAKEVGGDLYDFFIEDNKLYIIIGDVSGKGVPASLFMLITISLFRIMAPGNNTSSIIKSLNNAISKNNDAGMFVTFFAGILDLTTGVLEYCNAGHNPPIVIPTAGKPYFLPVKSNIPLGMFADFEYEEQRVNICPNSSLLLYTDGLTEAENGDKVLYGEERLLETIAPLSTYNAQHLIEKILDSVRSHVKGAEQNDDLTAMCLRYIVKEEGEPKRKVLKLKNKVCEISKLERFFQELSEELTLDSGTTMNLNLVLEEAISNVILYAYPKDVDGTVTLIAEYNKENLVFIITDQGKEFDPTAAKEADITLSAKERPIGGLGIFLIKQIMDKVEYTRITDSNVLTLTKKL